MPDLIPVDLFTKEADTVAQQFGLRLVHVGRHQETPLETPVEEFAMGPDENRMVLFELPVQSPDGMTRQEAIIFAHRCMDARDELLGRPPPPEVMH